MRRATQLILLFSLVLILAACGRSEPEADPTATTEVAPAATNTPVPTDTPVPEPTATDTPVAAESNSGAESDEGSAAEVAGEEVAAESAYASPSSVLDSFRSRGNLNISSTFEDGTTMAQQMVLEGAYVKPVGSEGEGDESIVLDVTEGETQESLAIYKVGENVFINTEGEWLTLGRDQAEMFTMMADIFSGLMEEFAVGMDRATNLGTENVNGIDATHFLIDDPAIFIEGVGELGETEEIDEVDMNVWVANDGNYILKYQIQATVTGATEFDDEGNEVTANQTIDWSFEIYDIGQVAAIELPEDAPEPGVVNIPGFAEGEFPLPEGAELRTSILGAEVVSTLPEAEISQFYQDALTDLGWEVDGAVGFFEATKGEDSFSYFIQVDEETGGTTVQILSSQ